MKVTGRKHYVWYYFSESLGQGLGVQEYIPVRTSEYCGDSNFRHSVGTGAGCDLRPDGDQREKILQVISRVYVEIMQNTPILLQLCFFYYALAFSGHSIGILPTGIVALGVYTGAYMAEVVRAGIESIPKGQFEAAQSQGFTYVERMYYIILPQSIKIILPPMVNQIVNLIKNTSCLYIIGGADLISLTYSFVTGENTGGAYAPAYLVSGLLFSLYVIHSPRQPVSGRFI